MRRSSPALLRARWTLTSGYPGSCIRPRVHHEGRIQMRPSWLSGFPALSPGEDLGEEAWFDVAAADHGHGEARGGQFFSVEQVGGERDSPARLCDQPDPQRQAAHGFQDLPLRYREDVVDEGT